VEVAAASGVTIEVIETTSDCTATVSFAVALKAKASEGPVIAIAKNTAIIKRRLHLALIDHLLSAMMRELRVEPWRLAMLRY